MKPLQPSHSGFTLIELMVVLVIFSLIALTASGSLMSLLRSKSALEERSQKLAALQNALLIQSNDLSQTTLRVFNAQQKDAPPPNGGILLEVIRLGWKNPLDESRNELARTRYLFADHTLIRQLFVASPTAGNVSLSSTLFSGIEAPAFNRVLQNEEPSAVLPTAFDITFDYPPFGSFRQLIAVVKQP